MVADWTRVEDWEILYLDGNRIPGVARLEADAPTGLDKQKPRGKKRARLVDRGAEPAVLSVELEVFPEEMDDLFAAMNTLRPRSLTAAQKPLTIAHPVAAFYSINLVKVGKMGSPHPAPGGTFLLRFELLEHCPDPKKVKKPKDTTKEAEEWGGVQNMIDALRPSKNNAVERNFTAPEDVQNFSEQSGESIFVPEPSMSGGG